MAFLLATHPHSTPIRERKRSLTAWCAGPDIPSVARPTLDGMYPVSEEGPQGRQAARGMTARPLGARLLGGVRPV